ncbi:NAD-dependent epimerase/dehydratase family protein [Streptomyces acidiscabies]|uniref:NAD-dependent epimerase/dehydratase family protein n=1 Tax=Streptomyces acidiscabies TaxID=42234 RepID=UPI0038F79303
MSTDGLRARRVLVIGCGLTGSAVVRRMHGAGADVVCADLDGERARAVAGTAAGQWLRLDLGDREQTMSALRSTAPEIVVHAAGRLTARSARDAGRLVTGTAASAAHLAEAAVSAGVPRLVLLSSLGVYGASAGGPPVRETAPIRPVTPYGAAKAAAEAILTGCCAGTGTAVRIGRLAGVYGPGARAGGGWMAAALLRLLALHLTGRPVSVPARLHDREYLHTDDAATALTLLAAAPEGVPPVLNIGTGRPTPVQEVADAFRALGADVVRPRPADGTPNRPLDVSAAARALGFTARTTLPDGLAAWCAQLRKEGP